MEKHNKSKVCVCGLGYVGLPLLLLLHEHFEVVGYDIDDKKLENLRKSYDSTGELSDSEKAKLSSIRLSSSLKECQAEIYIVTVPTPVSETNVPDLSILEDISKAIALQLQENDLVIYESTVYPGATEDICIPLLEAGSGLKLGDNFGVAYSPERINPGDKINTLQNTVKLLSATSDEYLSKARSCYEPIVDQIYICDTIKIAEASKVLENTQRDVNIALMNEVSKIFVKMGIDTKKVLDAAETKWNFQRYHPGFVGGHCIGVDPYYLTTKAEIEGIRPELILTSRAVNEAMPRFIFERIVHKLLINGFDISKGRILVLGASFKPNCPDTRNSKVFTLIKYFHELNISVDLFDKLCDQSQIEFVSLPHETETYDCIILGTPHKYFIDDKDIYIRSHLKRNGILVDLYGAIPELHRVYCTITL